MRFIKLTEDAGNVIYIDAYAIEAVVEFEVSHSRIDLISNCTYWVLESPEAIVAMLEHNETVDAAFLRENVDLEPDETLVNKSLGETINLDDAIYKNYRCRNCREKQLTSVHL